MTDYTWMQRWNDYVERLAEEEGFRGTVYKDHLGFPTIGYGTLLPLTPEEGRLLLDHRARAAVKELREALEPVGIDLNRLPVGAWAVLCDVAYNCGVPKLLLFQRMLAAIRRADWKTAADELLDSRYAQQVPNRAKRNADLLRGCA